MEGNLLKWTNYWMGWQLRYFVLKDGILAYFNGENEIKSGAKRSFKIFMFDIIVSKHDNTRLDLIVANDQHLYLKACDYKERQKWLVALASQKATHSTKNVINNSASPHAGTSSSSSTNVIQNSDEKTTQHNVDDHSDTYKILTSSFQQNLTPFDTTNMLKLKQSELRLYCDLLAQQTHELKQLVNAQNNKSNLNINAENNNITSDEIDKTQPKSIDIIDLSKNKNTVNDTSSAASSFKSAGNLSTENLSIENNENDGKNDEQKCAPVMSMNENSNNNRRNVNSIKKMDEVTSNLNITCDMVIQIIRNVIVLSNTSSNVSPAALASLLEQSNLNQHSGITNSDQHSDFLHDNLSQYRYHLHHPLHTNNKLNKYRNTSSNNEPTNNEK